MKHSLKTQQPTDGGDRRGSSRRVSLSGVPLAAGERRVSLSTEAFHDHPEKKKVTVHAGSLVPTTLSGEELARQFVKKDAATEMSEEVEALLKTFFSKMDANCDGVVTKDEAAAHWSKNFAKVNAKSMFNEVDEDGNESVSWGEFRAFWKNVVGPLIIVVCPLPCR